MAKLIKFALKLMEHNSDPNLNPLQNPELNSSQNPNLNDTQNPELAVSQNPRLHPQMNPKWKSEEWRLLIEYLGDYLTQKQLDHCGRHLNSL